MDAFEAELHAIALRQSQEYRVLRRLARRQIYDRPLPKNAKIGLLVDCETTGLNPHSDTIIELGLVRFAYTPSGVVLGPLAAYQSFQDPGRPIPAPITHMTGITDVMVKDRCIDRRRVGDYIDAADLIIAHNAAFDRRFCERFHPGFIEKPWACSQTQVPWSQEAIEGTKLFYISVQMGFWFEGHRAEDDCYGLLEILEMPLPVSGRTALSRLLEAARRPTFRVWALGAPYEIKDALRERGYRWNIGEDGRPRAWHREVDAEKVEAERDFLDGLGFPDLIEPLVMEVDAYLRFSDRQA